MARLGRSIVRSLARDGVIALILAGMALLFLRRLQFGAVLMLTFPSLFAALHTRQDMRPTTRAVAWAFLAFIGFGTLIAPWPVLFPELGGFDQQLPKQIDRMLGWYTGIYLIWFFFVMPAHLFIGNLKARSRGEPTSFSRPTCYLGLFAAALMTLGLPALLARFLGFWPIIR